MKTMTCKQLGGACDKVFSGNTFNEIAQQSKAHEAEMFQANDKAHLEAMNAMGQLMNTEGAFEKWFKEKQKKFDAL